MKVEYRAWQIRYKATGCLACTVILTPMASPDSVKERLMRAYEPYTFSYQLVVLTGNLATPL